MLQQLNKIGGSVMGMMLYPLKSLFVNTGVVCLTLFLGLLTVTLIPIIIATVFYRNSNTNKFRDAFIAGALSFLALSLIAPVWLAVVLFKQLRYAVMDVFSNIRLGIIDGYDNGLFFHVIRQAFPFHEGLVFSSYLRELVTNVNDFVAQFSVQHGLNQNQLNELNAEPVDYTNLPDVPRTLNEVPDLSDPARLQRVFTPLTDDEKTKARTLPALNDVLGKYQDLYDRLNKLDKAIAARLSQGNEGALDNKMITDEVIVEMEITDPCLLVKQFEDASGQWKAVPDLTHITDQSNFETWMKINKHHPLCRDIIDKPENYQGKATRYKLYPYQSMANAQLLIDMVLDIRRGLETLQVRPISVIASAGYSAITANIQQTFFHGAASAERDGARRELSGVSSRRI